MLTAAEHHAGLWSSTNSLLGVSINQGAARNPLQQPMLRQACSLHACTTSTAAPAESCKLQHVAQLQLQQGALILEPKVLLQALLLKQSSQADLTSNTTDPAADPAQQTNNKPSAASDKSSSANSTSTAAAAAASKPTRPLDAASIDSSAVTLHMAACCEQQQQQHISSSISSSKCLDAPQPAAAPDGAAAAQSGTIKPLQDTLHTLQQQQQQQERDDEPVWTNTVTVTLSEAGQQARQQKAAAGCPPVVEQWDVATPEQTQPDQAHVAKYAAAQEAHRPAGTAAAASTVSASSASAGLQDSSSEYQQLLLVELHLPAVDSVQPAAQKDSSAFTEAAAKQQAAQAVTAGSFMQLWLGRAGMLLLVLAAQVAIYRFATT